MLHDDIKADAGLAYRGVLEFLGIDTDFEPDFTVVNPNTRTKNQYVRKLIQGLWFSPLRQVIPGGVRGWGRRGLEHLQKMNTQAAERPPLDATIRSQLQAQFREDVDRLSQLINRPLNSWME